MPPARVAGLPPEHGVAALADGDRGQLGEEGSVDQPAGDVQLVTIDTARGVLRCPRLPRLQEDMEMIVEVPPVDDVAVALETVVVADGRGDRRRAPIPSRSEGDEVRQGHRSNGAHAPDSALPAMALNAIDALHGMG